MSEEAAATSCRRFPKQLLRLALVQEEKFTYHYHVPPTKERPIKCFHMYLNSVQQMVSGELARECLQTRFERHGLPPQRAPLDTVYPFREHTNSVQRMVSEGYCEGLFPDTVCWRRLRKHRKQYAPPPWRPSFFLFAGLRFYGVYPSSRTYGVYPFPLFYQENGIHHSFSSSVTSGSGDRPRKEGSRGCGVCSFSPDVTNDGRFLYGAGAETLILVTNPLTQEPRKGFFCWGGGASAMMYASLGCGTVSG